MGTDQEQLLVHLIKEKTLPKKSVGFIHTNKTCIVGLMYYQSTCGNALTIIINWIIISKYFGVGFQPCQIRMKICILETNAI